MPLPDDPDAFEAAFRAAVSAILPSASVERVARTIIVIKLRVDLGEHRLVDVFFNGRNQRVDLAVIDRGGACSATTTSVAGIVIRQRRPIGTTRVRNPPLRRSCEKP